MSQCNIKFEDCLLDEDASLSLVEANFNAHDKGFKYFSYNGFVFMTMSAFFKQDISYTGFEESDLVGYPTDEELSDE